MTQDAIEVEGIVRDILGGGKYLVYAEDMDMEIEAYAAGKMKKFNIRIIPGDLVQVELNPYEPTKGRITYRSINKVRRGATNKSTVAKDDSKTNEEEDTKE